MRSRRRRDGPPRRAKTQTGSPVRRVLTGVVLFTFVLQLGRFYLAASANQDLCPEQSPATAGDPHHGLSQGHSHDEAQQPAAADPEGGPFFQHGKEHVFSIGLTHVQPLGEPEDVSIPWSLSAAVAVLPSLLPFAQHDLTTPFHPPRHLS